MIITAPAQLIIAPVQLITAPIQLITAPALPPATKVAVERKKKRRKVSVIFFLKRIIINFQVYIQSSIVCQSLGLSVCLSAYLSICLFLSSSVCFHFGHERERFCLPTELPQRI